VPPESVSNTGLPLTPDAILIQKLLQKIDPDLHARSDLQQLAALGVMAVLLSTLGWAVIALHPMVQITVVISMLMVLTFFTRPEISLLVFFALRAVFDLLWWIPGQILTLNMMELFTGAVTGMALVLFIMDLKRLDWHPVLKGFVPYVIVLLIALMRNLELRSAAEIMARYISPLLIMFLVSHYFDTPERRERLFKTATAVGLIPVSLALWHLANGQMSHTVIDGYHRLIGAYKNLHNHALMEMFISSMVLWWVLQMKPGKGRWFMALYLCASLLCLYLTYVRTALLSLAAFVAVFMYLTGRKKVLVFGIFAVAGFVAINPDMQDRFKDIIEFLVPDPDKLTSRRKLGSGRLGLWSSSFKEYLRYPLGDILLGLGFGKHWLLTREYFNPYALAQHGYVDPHSDYLTMTYQVGPIATLSYMWMQFTAIRCAWKVRLWSPDPWVRNFAIYIIALAVASFFANSISNAFINRTTLGWYFWGLAGIMFAQYRALILQGAHLSPPSQAGPTEVPRA
jgi:hypothetical protein